MDESAPELSWIEQTLIEAWAGSAAPPAPPSTVGGAEPWFACYATDAAKSSSLSDWQKCVITDPSDARHGCAYYHHGASQTTQWERPNGYESPLADVGTADDEARRQARYLSGEMDEQTEAAAAAARCTELLAVGRFSTSRPSHLISCLSSVSLHTYFPTPSSSCYFSSV